MALVHVVDLGSAAEGVEHVDAAEAEDGLLAEAVEAVAAVEVVGEAAIPGVIAFDVGVEEEDGEDVAGDAGDIVAPGADEHAAAVHEEFDGLVGQGEGGFGGPGDVGLGLLSDAVEVLAEVSAAVDEGDGDHGSGHVGSGAEGISGEDAEAA